MKRYLTIFLAISLAIAAIYILTDAFVWSLKNQTMFDEKGYSELDDFIITINGNETVEYTEFPVNVALKYLDTVTLTTTLKGLVPEKTSLFFRTYGANVTVTLDGELLYSSKNKENLPLTMWHFVELPEDCVNKVIDISLQKSMPYISISVTLHEIGLGDKSSALWNFFIPKYGLMLYLAVTIAVISFGLIIFSLILLIKNKNAIKIFYFFLIAFVISIWGICNNWMTYIFWGNNYFFYCINFLSQCFFLVAIMLYLGECYHKKYKNMFHTIIIFDLIKQIALIFLEVSRIRLYTENLYVIDFILVIEVLIVMYVMIFELIKKNKENRMIASGLLCISFLGIYECVRFIFFSKTTITNNLYYGTAFVLVMAIIEIIRDYYKETDDAKILRMHHNETMRLLNIQQKNYQRISTQLDVSKRVSHDLKYYNAVIHGAIQSESTKNLKQLLEQTEGMFDEMQMALYTDCLEINGVINFAAENCQKDDIKFVAVVNDLNCNADIIDLCVIIGNILDNAIEGAKTVIENRFVTFFAGRHEDVLIVRTENPYSGILNIIDGKIKTLKQDKDFHGLGLSIIEETLKKYDGELLLETEKGVFKTVVLIPCKTNQDSLV